MSPRRSTSDESDRVQRYLFEGVLGQGGSGWVALATDTRLGRRVAVKTVYGGTLDAQAVARLRREARVLAAAGHPFVAKVFELLSEGPDVFVVMEYAPGGDLRSALQEGRVAGSDVVRILDEVADALAVAAARDIVHRDVKPSNVLLTASGQARLADFGLARLPRASGAFRTGDGSVSGTLAYMAPEQLADPEADAPQLDWFAFAAMAYEVLTGSLPLAAHGLVDRWEPSAELAQALETLPPGASAALLGGLEQDPTLRLPPWQVTQALLAVPAKVWDERVVARADGSPAQPTYDGTLPSLDRGRSMPTAVGFPFLPSESVAEEPSLAALPAVIAPVFVPPRRGLAGRRLPAVVGVCVGLVIGVVIALLLH